MSKVVFVGNVPYNMGEDQLIDVFKSVGQVVGFRLVFDRDTGKPKGYGFCEFLDHDTALSAVRNLNGQDIGGRPLRIDLADSDPFLEGKTTVRGEIIDGGETRAQWRERERERERDGPYDYRERERDRERGPPKRSDAFLRELPPGVPVPPGSTTLDTISQMLATANPAQILEVLAQMKAFVITHPEQARALLMAHPQLGYALFQALLLNKIVDPAILQRMLAATGASVPAPQTAPAPQAPPQMSSQPAPYPGAPAYPPPPHGVPPGYGMPPMPAPAPPVHHPAPSMYAPPPPPSQQHMSQMPQMPTPMGGQPPLNPYYRAPSVPGLPPQSHHQMQPPPQQQPPPAAQPAVPEFSAAQREMLMSVLSLTQDQINSLPPAEREQIVQLRKQFMGAAA